MLVRVPRPPPGHRATEWAAVALGAAAGVFGTLAAPARVGLAPALASLVAVFALALSAARRGRLVRSTAPGALAGATVAATASLGGFLVGAPAPHAWGELVLGALLALALLLDAWLSHPGRHGLRPGELARKLHLGAAFWAARGRAGLRVRRGDGGERQVALHRGAPAVDEGARL